MRCALCAVCCGLCAVCVARCSVWSVFEVWSAWVSCPVKTTRVNSEGVLHESEVDSPTSKQSRPHFFPFELCLKIWPKDQALELTNILQLRKKMRNRYEELSPQEICSTTQPHDRFCSAGRFVGRLLAHFLNQDTWAKTSGQHRCKTK